MAQNNTAENRENKKISSIIALGICVILSFCMWIYVMTVESPNHEQLFEGVTVELTGTDALSENELAIFSGYGVKVDVMLSGKKSVVSKIKAEDLVVTADLSKVSSSGRYSLKAIVDVPAGCKLVSLSQDTIPVYVDQSAQIVVDLEEKRENTVLPEGCFTGTIDLSIDKVTVSGPLAMLSKIDGALVTLDMSGITKTMSVTEKIVLVDENGAVIDSPYIDYYPKEITVEIPILKTTRIPLEVEYKNGFLSYDSTNVVFEPEFVDVTGDAELVNKGECIKPVTIDEKASMFGEKYVTVVTLEGAEGLELSTQKAKLTISLKSGYSVREFSVAEENIMPTGEKSGVVFTWQNRPVAVELLGRSDVLSRLTDADIKIVFDMSPYSDTNTGSVRVKADIILPDVYKNDIISVGSYFISVSFGKADD